MSYANVVSTLALVLAMSGTAYAVATVTSGDIVNKTIKVKDISNGAVLDLLPRGAQVVMNDGGVLTGTNSQTVASVDIPGEGNFLVFAKMWLNNEGSAVTMLCTLNGVANSDLNHVALAAAGAPGSTESMAFDVVESFDSGAGARILCDPQGGTVHVFDLKITAVQIGDADETVL
jgi:hypothetical protein